MTAMELYENVQEIAQNKTPNNVIFAIYQLAHQIDYALEDGMNQNVINEVFRDALKPILVKGLV